MDESQQLAALLGALACADTPSALGKIAALEQARTALDQAQAKLADVEAREHAREQVERDQRVSALLTAATKDGRMSEGPRGYVTARSANAGCTVVRDGGDVWTASNCTASLAAELDAYLASLPRLPQSGPSATEKQPTVPSDPASREITAADKAMAALLGTMPEAARDSRLQMLQMLGVR